jgi:hypothetical protein
MEFFSKKKIISGSCSLTIICDSLSLFSSDLAFCLLYYFLGGGGGSSTTVEKKRGEPSPATGLTSKNSPCDASALR